jgi:riboflavin kinase/FMN adenylyltransferase
MSMRVIHGFRSTPAALRGCVLAIGNFDGIHRGHQEVLSTAVDVARRKGVEAGVLTFDPHPRTFFAPHNPVFQITSSQFQQRLLPALGLTFMAVLEFNSELAGREPEEFVTDVLADGFSAVHVVTGEDFRFGRARAGDLAALAEFGVKNGFGVTGVVPVGDVDGEQQHFSSTSVRQALLHGNPRAAADILGYWWTVMGEVISGDQRGRDIGFPTVNIVMPENSAPRIGIYAVRVRAADGDREVWKGAGYVGRRPTFGKDELVLEVHLFDFTGDLYGRTLMVEFVEFIRGDEKFEGVEKLVARMQIDCQKARLILDDLTGDTDPMSAYPLGRAQAQNSL